jgi:hypothetical protein
MLLHWNFCLEWFDSNSKEKFKIYLKFLGKNWKKKKKTFSISFLAFGPSAQLPPAFFPASSWSAARPSRAVDSARPVSPPRLGPSHRRPVITREQPFSLSSLSLADTVGLHVRAASFLKPTPKSPSLFATDRIHPLNLFFP